MDFLAWRQLRKFWQIRIHVVPWLRAGCVDIGLWPIPARSSRLPTMMSMIPAAADLPSKRGPEVGQKRRWTMLRLWGGTSEGLTAGVMLRAVGGTSSAGA